jgi:hypothetical protein
MIEKVMNINAIPSYLVTPLHANVVKVTEGDRVITIGPAEDAVTRKNIIARCLALPKAAI